MAVTEFGLSRADKILKADAYASALRMRVCAQSADFALHFCAHQAHLSLTQDRAQLGLVIPKKLAKHAVRRNVVKRLAREYFRTHKQDLPHGLWVLRLKSKVNAKILCGAQKKAWAAQMSQLFDVGKSFAIEYNARNRPTPSSSIDLLNHE